MSPGALVKFHVLVQDSFVGLGVHLKKYHEKKLKLGVIKKLKKYLKQVVIKFHIKRWLWDYFGYRWEERFFCKPLRKNGQTSEIEKF